MFKSIYVSISSTFFNHTFHKRSLYVVFYLSNAIEPRLGHTPAGI